MQRSKRRSPWVAMLLAAALAACGGGGSPDDDAAAPGSGTGAATDHRGGSDGRTDGNGSDDDASGDGPGTPPDVDLGCGLPDFQAEALRLINQHRAAGASCGSAGSFAPAAPVAWDARLAQAAYAHSRDMAEGDFFSHTGSDGSSLGQRVTAAGYRWSGVAENIAAGYPTVAAVVAGWMTSPGHCANLMRPDHRHVGLACAARDGSTYRTYWTLDLATPR